MKGLDPMTTPDSPTGDVDLDALLIPGTVPTPAPVPASPPKPVSVPVTPAEGIVTPPKPARPAPAVTLDQQRIRELEHQLALRETQRLEATVDEEIVAVGEEKILIHFLMDGFTCQGRVWYKGQELEFDVPGPAYDGTKDTHGVSWLSMDEAAQMIHYGKVYFRFGPWPGTDWDNDSEAGQKERARRRAVPVPAVR